MVAAELGPYVRETDAADAVAASSKALRQLGHDVTVVVPRYPGFESAGLLLARRLTPVTLPGGSEVPVLDGQLPSGVKLTLFDAPVLFDRPGVFGEGGKDYPDNAKRFGLLCQAAAALVKQRAAQGQTFDIIHVHDWPAALVPAAMQATSGPKVPVVLTIHDVTRQGVFPVKDIDALGVSKELASSDGLKLGSKLNVLKGGVLLADTVTTVSRHYAEELTNDELTGPFAAALRDSGKEVVGITHGVDYAVCNPATDTLIVSRYDAEDVSNKGRSKTDLVRELDLELDTERPLVCVLAAPTKDKGLDLVASALPQIMKNNLTLVVGMLGAGPVGLTKKLAAGRQKYAPSYAFIESPDDRMVHRMYAAADLVLVPSRHEPCGESQLYAQRYGSAPVVHGVGGLVDTVVDCDAALETGSGFVFDEPTAKALLGALQRGLAAYSTPAWPRLRRRIMRLDVGWDRPARRYLQVYRQTIGASA